MLFAMWSSAFSDDLFLCCRLCDGGRRALPLHARGVCVGVFFYAAIE
nr:MAG TPA: hypothetical protein [Bacteriophage sp.]